MKKNNQCEWPGCKKTGKHRVPSEIQGEYILCKAHLNKIMEPIEPVDDDDWSYKRVTPRVFGRGLK